MCVCVCFKKDIFSKILACIKYRQQQNNNIYSNFKFTILYEILIWIHSLKITGTGNGQTLARDDKQ